VTRATYRFREHTIVPDERPGAEPWTFAMQCVTCGETGPEYQVPEEVTGWAAGHLRANPGHLAYREHVTRPYRVEAGAWQ
jgi:hypothetical protein